MALDHTSAHVPMHDTGTRLDAREAEMLIAMFRWVDRRLERGPKRHPTSYFQCAVVPPVPDF
jgi:hypothetical protein